MKYFSKSLHLKYWVTWQDTSVQKQSSLQHLIPLFQNSEKRNNSCKVTELVLLMEGYVEVLEQPSPWGLLLNIQRCQITGAVITGLTRTVTWRKNLSIVFAFSQGLYKPLSEENRAQSCLSPGSPKAMNVCVLHALLNKGHDVLKPVLFVIFSI